MNVKRIVVNQKSGYFNYKRPEFIFLNTNTFSRQTCNINADSLYVCIVENLLGWSSLEFIIESDH